MTGLVAKLTALCLGDPEARRLMPGRPPLLAFFASALVVACIVLALSVAAAAQRATDAWSGDIAGTGTLTIVAEEGEIEAQARHALAILREAPGISEVRMIEPAEQRALLAPWLGTGIAFEGLALPLMIDVTADRGALDAPALAARLAANVPGAVFEDHSAWRLPYRDAAANTAARAAAAALALALVLAALAALAGRGAVAAASAPVALLAGLGLTDRTILGAVLARLRAGLLAGCCLGAALGAALAGGLDAEAALTGYAAGFSGWSWLLPPAAALLAAALAAFSASLAARRALAEPA